MASALMDFNELPSHAPLLHLLEVGGGLVAGGVLRLLERRPRLRGYRFESWFQAVAIRFNAQFASGRPWLGPKPHGVGKEGDNT